MARDMRILSALLLITLSSLSSALTAQQVVHAEAGMRPVAISSAAAPLGLQRAGKVRAKGALRGALIGALVGGVLGPLTSSCDNCDGSLVEAASTGEEVLVGALVGATIGAVVGGVFLAPDRADHRVLPARRAWHVGVRLGR